MTAISKTGNASSVQMVTHNGSVNDRQGGIMYERCSILKHVETETSGGTGLVDSLVIPVEVLDLVRFMCSSWSDIDAWAYEHAGVDALCKYPVIQGTRNQIDLKRIGEQRFDGANIRKAVNWMLIQQE